MLFRNTYTAIDRDMQRIEPGPHQAVRIENPLLARPILVTALRSPKKLTWKQAQKWAASLDVYGWSWRLPETYEAALVPDYSRTSYPLTPTEFFPDCDGEIIWTATEDLTPPSGGARFVNLGYGDSLINHRGYEFFARAVRAGQSLGLSAR